MSGGNILAQMASQRRTAATVTTTYLPAVLYIPASRRDKTRARIVQDMYAACLQISSDSWTGRTNHYTCHLIHPSYPHASPYERWNESSCHHIQAWLHNYESHCEIDLFLTFFDTSAKIGRWFPQGPTRPIQKDQRLQKTFGPKTGVRLREIPSSDHIAGSSSLRRSYYSLWWHTSIKPVIQSRRTLSNILFTISVYQPASKPTKINLLFYQSYPPCHSQRNSVR